jgi:N-glycosidase YbiA
MNQADRLAQDGVEGEPILFYSEDDEYGCFSNFSDHSVVLPDRWGRENQWYKTGEHAFQARKMTTMVQHDQVRDARTAFHAKKCGGPRGVGVMRDGWGNNYGDLCWYVMLEVVTAKTIQHHEVWEALHDSRGQHIYEDSPVDDIWGWRFRNDYRGKNLLGRAFMTARDIIWVP